MTTRKAWVCVGALGAVSALGLVVAFPPRYAVAAPSASASASAAASPNAPSGTLATYAWPTQASERPKDEEWSKATVLESFKIERGTFDGTKCEPRVLREWVEVKCTPLGDALFSVLWGVGGDLKDVKGWFKMLGELGPPADPTSSVDRIKIGGAAYGTLSFPVRQGSAFVLSLDRLGVDENYDGGIFIGTSQGIVVDVSWVAGEKAPTILFR
jgi:hypothetical protein